MLTTPQLADMALLSTFRAQQLEIANAQMNNTLQELAKQLDTTTKERTALTAKLDKLDEALFALSPEERRWTIDDIIEGRANLLPRAAALGDGPRPDELVAVPAGAA